jgi:three-Cys-motif partner protein
LVNPCFLIHKPSLSAQFHNDGFSITAAEPWFKVKVKVLQSYLQTFITQAMGKADALVYVDLCAGGGLYSHGHQKEIFPSASLSALAAGWPFTQWILCEHHPEELAALKARVQGNFRAKNVTILDHHPDELADKLRQLTQPNKGNRRVITLCLVDTFSMDVNFALIRKLAEAGFNFLIPFTFSLNARHDHGYYLNEHPEKLKKFLGTPDLSRLQGVESNIQLYKRLVRMYQNNMLMLGLNTTLTMHRADSRLMELPAYYVGFFSRQLSVRSLQRDIREAQHEQLELFL